MKHTSHQTPVLSPAEVPSQGAIRDYANHLYEVRDYIHGHDQSDWLEAEAHLSSQLNRHSGESHAQHRAHQAELASHNRGEI